MLLSDLQLPIYRPIITCQGRRLTAHLMGFGQMVYTERPPYGSHEINKDLDFASLCQWCLGREVYQKDVFCSKNEYYTSFSALQKMEEGSVGEI